MSYHSLLRNQKGYALADSDIKHILEASHVKSRVTTHEELSENDTIEGLLKGVDVCIILLQIISHNVVKEVGHWSVLGRVGKNQRGYQYYFYESYGIGLAGVYARTHEKPVLQHIIMKNGRVDLERFRHQKLVAGDSICGRSAACRAVFGRDQTNASYNAFIRSSRQDPEVFVLENTLMFTMSN